MPRFAHPIFPRLTLRKNCCDLVVDVILIFGIAHLGFELAFNLVVGALIFPPVAATAACRVQGVSVRALA